MGEPRGPLPVDALAFDVFGTVVDWFSAVSHEAARAGERREVTADWGAFARAWRSATRAVMDRIGRGELTWLPYREVTRRALDETLARFGLELPPGEREWLVSAWERLRPWPDAPEALSRLRRRYLVTTLSNGSVGLLVRMARAAGLTWDCVLSAELARAYKPHRAVYATAARLLELEPGRIMMVACHPYDLEAAAAAGMRTAYVERPLESGPGQPLPCASGDYDLRARDLIELADLVAA